MPNYAWPGAAQRILIGKRIPRIDSPAKVSGQAKYTYDVHRLGMLYGKVICCPYAHAKIISIDTGAAQKMPGVKAIHIVQQAGSTIFWAGDVVVAIAAIDEPSAEDAARVVKVEYQKLSHLVSDAEPAVGAAGPAVGPMSENDIWEMDLPDEQVASEVQKRGVNFRATEAVLAQLRKFMMAEVIVEAITKAPYRPLADENSGSLYQRVATLRQGDPDKAFAEADVVSEGLYGCSVITHCCLESHGSIMEWPDKDHLFTHMSTQGVSAIGAQLADPLNIPAANIRVHQEHIGGGFGSKFAVDRWDVASAQLSQKAGGQPVRIMLERDLELEVAGARPSAYARVRIAATRDGTITSWESRSWGTGGPGGGGMPPLPYVFDVPNQRKEHIAIRNNIGPGRAWRAPSAPQAAVITMGALNDLAAKLNMDPLDLWLKNLDITGRHKETFREELGIAAELMRWKQKWQPQAQNRSGSLARGLGLSLHLWGGRGHASDCDLTLHLDGLGDIKIGSQDLGTGTRTVIAVVAAETLGIPLVQSNSTSAIANSPHLAFRGAHHRWAASALRLDALRSMRVMFSFRELHRP